MDLMRDIVTDAVGDTLGLVPFLFITYLVLEALEHFASDKLNSLVRRAGAAGPVVGALLGIVPQCGFSAMGATLYAGRIVTLGTLLAVFLSTSDEMLPILVAEQVNPVTVGSILISKALIALMAGLLIDALVRVLRAHPRMHAMVAHKVLGRPLPVFAEISEAGEGTEHIHELCERAHCGCNEDEHHNDHQTDDNDGSCVYCVASYDMSSISAFTHDDGEQSHAHEQADRVSPGENAVACDSLCACHTQTHEHTADASTSVLIRGVVHGAVVHTVQVTVFIFLVTLVLTGVLDTVGEAALASFLSSNTILATFAAALVGLIPNCAASVVITQLYLEGALALGPMMAGTLVASGAGLLVLFRTNRNLRENIVILALLYVIGVVCGLILTAVGL